MKSLILVSFSILICQFGLSQNSVLTFDGINDHVDLGVEVGNNVRTIELWFKLENEITPQLGDFSTLVAREISGTSGNTNEFTFSFQPYFVSNPGKLRFDVDGTAPYKSVFSDNDTWMVDQWYHVAAVIHPDDGMALFVDGIKQASTHPHSAATTNSIDITTIGCWGKSYIRYFKGEIDDLRFSSEALYDSDFSLTCPDLKATSSSLGLWNFNEDAGIIAVDSSGNSYDGEIDGASREADIVCVLPLELSFSVLPDMLPCFGDETASILVEISGGYPAFTYTWDNVVAVGSNPINLSAGTYCVTVTDANGASITSCTDILEPASALDLNMTEIPANPSNMEGTATATVTGGTMPYSYSWDTDPIQTTETAIGLASDIYNVTVTDANGCEVIESIYVGLMDGVNDFTEISHLLLFPNPTQGKLFLELDFEQAVNISIKLFNRLGQELSNQTHAKSTEIRETIDLTNLSSGMYFLSISSGDKQLSRKVILN